ncbi:hypothetical protein NM688_g6356 [Phlebia brevispora]|uniref:Uncharacterized protein n=1 Tax=Phlebia brevispora TaxID=194682 RepID=A0ACC1SH50_9APHY|nr:hypothetical protein NM688_g6356 [Phlebia brevispora]
MDRCSNSYFGSSDSVPFNLPHPYKLYQEEYTAENQNQDHEREYIEFWNTRWGGQGIMLQDLQDGCLRDPDSRPFEKTVERADGTVEIERTKKTVGGKPEARGTLRKITLRLKFSGCVCRKKPTYAECRMGGTIRSKTLMDFAWDIMGLLADYLDDKGLVLERGDGQRQVVALDDIVLKGFRKVSPGSFQPIVECWVF